MKRFIAGGFVCLAVSGAAVVSAQSTKYGVTATAEKNVDFARFKTYGWTASRPASNPTADKQIIAAVDRELSALGMTKAAGNAPPDVLVTYSSITREDVDVKGKADEKGARPQYTVGTLVVALLEPSNRRQLLLLRADKPIDPSPDLEPVINAVTAELFAQYPTRQKK